MFLISWVRSDRQKSIFNWPLGQKTLGVSKGLVGRGGGGGVKKKKNTISNAKKVASFQSLWILSTDKTRAVLFPWYSDLNLWEWFAPKKKKTEKRRSDSVRAMFFEGTVLYKQKFLHQTPQNHSFVSREETTPRSLGGQIKVSFITLGNCISQRKITVFIRL